MKKIVLLGITALSIATLYACSPSTNTTDNNSTATSVSEEDITVEEYFDALVSKIDKVTTDNYSSEDYWTYDYKTILREPMEYFSVKIWIYNLEIIQVIEEGKYTRIIAATPNNDTYMLFIETNRMETKFLEDDILQVNGRYLLDYEYSTLGGVDKTVPLIYIDAYRIDNA